MTYRFRAHSMYDPDLYRSKSEVEKWKDRDPIKLFSSVLTERGLLPQGTLERLEQAIDAEINEAIQFAEESPLEPLEDLLKDVYTPTSTTQTERVAGHEPAA